MYVTAAQTAKLVRTEARAAVRAGTIKLPEGARLSVRSETFAGGSSVDIYIVDGPAGWALVEPEPGQSRLSPAARRLGDQFEAILRKHLDGPWGSVMTGGGLVLGTVARRGWVPGQD